MMSRTSQMDGPIGVQERRSGFLNERAPSLGQFGSPFSVTIKQLKSVLFFKFRDLPAESALRNAQAMRSSGEIQLFGQNYDRIQMTHIQNPTSI